MDFKKIKIKNSANLFGIVVAILISVAFFVTLFNYVNNQASYSGVTLSENYGNTTTELNNAQGRVKSNMDSIKSGLNKVTEPQEGIFSILNGLQGLASVFLLPITLIDVGIQSYQAINGIVSSNTGIPSGLLITFEVGLLAGLLFIVWSAMKGDQQKII